jgi:CRISPR-associated protein Cmr3
MYGVLVEVSLEDSFKDKINGFVAPFGGESRLAKIQVLDNEEVEKAIKLHKLFIASPAIVDENIEKVNEEVKKIVDGKLKDIECKKDNKEIIHAIENKITYRLISLGFDRGKRGQMKLALMPTVEIDCQPKIKKAFLFNMGQYGKSGWGAVSQI